VTLRVVPEGLAAAGAAIETLTARLAAAHAGAAPLITAVVPPAAGPVSLHSAAGFSIRGGAHAAMAARGPKSSVAPVWGWTRRAPATPAVMRRRLCHTP